MAFQILCLASFFRVTHDPYEEFFAFVSENFFVEDEYSDVHNHKVQGQIEQVK